MVKTLFLSIDTKNIKDFADFLDDDSVFRFGNQPEVHGKANITGYVAAFFDSVHSLQHHITDTWQADDETLICQGKVTYIRHDRSKLTVPFANILKYSGIKIREYLIFVDNSALYQQS